MSSVTVQKMDSRGPDIILARLVNECRKLGVETALEGLFKSRGIATESISVK
jgi:hypothetical protein